MTVLLTLFSVLRARWFWTLLGATILSLVVWFVGDLVSFGTIRPLEAPTTRLAVVIAIALTWGGWNLFAQARARRENATLLSNLAEPIANGEPGSAEIAEVDRKFITALNRLKQSRLGTRGRRRWLYQLPWYVMIGPPGSGKSTALAQSGLKLHRGRVQELQGVAGTRQCEWVFTDSAVLIDTAGRWTLQEDDPEGHKAVWLGFLDLLRQRRPQHPLNGVLIALSAIDLMQGDAEVATRIRERLAEIETRLGMRLPVYLIVTKADLIAGFEPFFADFSEAHREQVWGYSFDHRPGHRETPDLEGLRSAFADLVARLDLRVPGRLAAEPDLDRRAEIFCFPAQVQRFSTDVTRFVEHCFRSSQYESGAWLRGVYLTSGTQTGTPVDRLLTVVARSVGVPMPALTVLSGDRSFFLRHLLETVIFGEASLAGHDLARDRKQRMTRQAALAVTAGAVVIAAAAWSWSFAGNHSRYRSLEAGLGVWARDVQQIAPTRLTAADADFTTVLPALDALANLDTGLEPTDPVSLRLGLSQRATAKAELDAAYRTALARLLLPRLILMSERGLRARIQDADYLTDGLKVYLALGGGAPVDPTLLQAWFELETANRLPQAVASTRRHVAALAASLPELEADTRPTLDARLVADARAVLARMPLPKRAYAMLIQNAAIKALPGWKVTEHAGPNASSTLTRRSGQTLTAEIPAILTYDGFHRVFLPLLDQFARGAYAEYWVLSGRSRTEASDVELKQLKSDMVRLYYDDYISTWDTLLRDVTVADMTTLDQAVSATKALSGPSSPLKLLMQSILRETALTVPADPAKAGQQATADAVKTAQSFNASYDRLAKLLMPGTPEAAPLEVPGAPVEAHFAYLRRIIEGANGAPPAIDEALTALATVHAKLADAAALPNPDEAFAKTGTATAAQFGQVAARLPDPLKQILAGVQKVTTDLGKSGALRQLNAVWHSDILPSCKIMIGNRFPFALGAAQDANVDDVTKALGPAGLLPTFIKTQLASFVDTTRQPWRDSQGIGFQPAALAQLARSQQITRALFPGGPVLKTSFNLTPVSLDGNAASASLEIDGQELRYSNEAPRPTPFTWPGPTGTNVVRLNFVSLANVSPMTVSKEGSWALFRLFAERGLRRTAQPDVYDLDLGAAGYTLRLRLRAASVENPFDLRLFSGFSCPEDL